jgi:preprotein translocase subunit SecD
VIQGFALVLILGVLASMFTAITVTRRSSGSS